MGDEVARWAAAARAYEIALRAYGEEVKAVPVGMGAPPEAPPPGATGVSLAKKALVLFAAVRDAVGALDRGADAALDPRKARAAEFRSSRTVVEGLGRARRKLKEARAQAHSETGLLFEALASRWGPRVAEAPPADVVPVLETAPADGSPLVVHTLRAWDASGEDVRALASRFADLALGVSQPPPAKARAEARAGLHPLQAMGITFGLAPRPASEVPPAGVFVDATLPQAATAVTYNLDPLVDHAAAAAFGSIGTAVSGLGFGLVRRFRTICERPVARQGELLEKNGGAFARGKIRTRVAPAAVARTIDGGATAQVLEGPLPAGAYSTLGAGPAPRLARLGELLGEAVTAAPMALLADREEFGRRFRDWKNAAPPPDRGPVIEGLTREFARAYDELAPPTPHSYKEVLLGEGGSRDPHRTYIAKALAAVGARRSELRAMRNDALAAAAVTFGDRRAASREVAREFLLSDLVQLWGGVAAVRAKLAAAFATLDAEVLAARVYELRGAARRRDALALHKRVAAQALVPPARTKGSARVVEKAESLDPRPTLKSFLLDRGDVSAS